MRHKTRLVVFLTAVVAGGAYLGYVATRPPPNPADDSAQNCPDLGCRVPVPTNRGPEIPDGFSGQTHPLLTRRAELAVTARWAPAGVGPLLPGLPADLDPVRRLFTTVGVAVPTRSYSERDFSPLLPPEGVTTAGRVWALDPARVAVFLTQFHPAVSAHSASVGRRPGPDGAFAVLQGVSPSHLDILFRAHAEFELAPAPGPFPATHVWYTPASFLGRVVVNRQAGAVEYFRLGVPTDLARNIHGTVLTAPDPDHPEGYRVYQFLRADRMELEGGSVRGLGTARWTDQIDTLAAYDKLAKVFYKFKDIDFLPFPEALAAARARGRPIFAFVALGALDDQSC